jgi:hypothetical protein
MAILAELMAAVEASEKMDAGKKSVVMAFLRAAGPTVEMLGEAGFAAVMGAVAGGGSGAAVIADKLSAPQVAAFLEKTEREMAGLAAAHGAEVRAAEAAVRHLEAAALMAVARVLLGAI